MKGLNYFQACELWLAGKAVRREAWHRWITWEHWMGWITQPAVDGLDASRRIALQSDFTDAEYLAADFTDEPWDAAYPAPIVEPSTGGGDSGSSGSSGRSDGPPSVLWGMSSGFGGASGNPGSVRPHDPPAVNPAVITISYATDLVAGGPACLLGSQFGSGQTCTVIMTVRITGGPAGVFDLHIQLGAESKPAESGFNGYVRDFAFTVPVNPGASLTPNVIYHAAGGDVTAATPLFAFPAACDGPDNITFGVRFQSALTFTVMAPPNGGGDPEPIGTGTVNWDFTKSFVSPSPDGTNVSGGELAPSDFDYGFAVGTGSGSTSVAAPAEILVDVASGTASNPRHATLRDLFTYDLWDLIGAQLDFSGHAFYAATIVFDGGTETVAMA